MRCTLCCLIERGLKKHGRGVGKILKANKWSMAIENNISFSKNIAPKITPETQKRVRHFLEGLDAQIKI